MACGNGEWLRAQNQWMQWNIWSQLTRNRCRMHHNQPAIFPIFFFRRRRKHKDSTILVELSKPVVWTTAITRLWLILAALPSTWRYSREFCDVSAHLPPGVSKRHLFRYCHSYWNSQNYFRLLMMSRVIAVWHEQTHSTLNNVAHRGRMAFGSNAPSSPVTFAPGWSLNQ